MPSVRNFLGLGRRETDPEAARLVDGQPSSSQGDLDSIFDKMDNPQPTVRMVLCLCGENLAQAHCQAFLSYLHYVLEAIYPSSPVQDSNLN